MNSPFLSVSIVVIALCVLGCGRLTGQRDFERRFERAAESPRLTNGATIQLSSMTPFVWDKVFIFHPYMTSDAIDSQLGFKWSGKAKREIEYSDWFELLVFVRAGKVVQYARIRRNLGDWSLDNRNGFSPGEDVFLVERPGAKSETLFRLRGAK